MTLDLSKLEEKLDSIEAGKSPDDPTLFGPLIEKIIKSLDERTSRFQEINESSNQVETDNSLNDHKSRIKERNLSYDDLLDCAASYSKECEVLELRNNVLNKLLDFHRYVTAIILRERFFEGKKEGRVAQKAIMARNGALAKKKSDPRQVEKIFIRECWKEWQKNPNRYASKAEFARDMLTKSSHLTSQKKIEDWCREWEANNSAQPAQ